MSPITLTPQTDYFSYPYPAHCYRLELGQGKNTSVKTGSEDREKVFLKKSILCKVCSATITSPLEGMAKNGLHEHVFFNPTGTAFEIRCYKRAPGCLIQGEPTSTFSWFDGYKWQYALCLTCLTHLGWCFSSRSDSFFGLIANRLME